MNVHYGACPPLLKISTSFTPWFYLNYQGIKCLKVFLLFPPPYLARYRIQGQKWVSRECSRHRSLGFHLPGFGKSVLMQILAICIIFKFVLFYFVLSLETFSLSLRLWSITPVSVKVCLPPFCWPTTRRPSTLWYFCKLLPCGNALPSVFCSLFLEFQLFRC